MGAVHEVGERAGEGPGALRPERICLVDEGEQRLLAPPEPPEERAFVEHDERARRALRARAPSARPLERGALGVRRVGRREHPGGSFALSLSRAPAKPLVGARQRELRPAPPVDEVAAPHAPRVLHRLEHVVDGGEAPRRCPRRAPPRA